MNLNKSFLLGRVTAAPQLRSTTTGTPVATMGVATNRQWKKNDGTKQEDVEFHNVVMFGRIAEIAAAHLAKGSLVLVEGRITTRSWEDKDGNTRRTTEIIAENIQLGPKPGERAAAPSKPDLADEEKLPALDHEDRIVNLDGDEDDTGRNMTSLFGEEKAEIKTEDIPF